MGELKPCPFCGGHEIVVIPKNEGEGWMMICHGCYVSIGSSQSQTRMEERWNRRAAPDALVEAQGQLLDAITVVSLLKLARGRMQHIVETATAAMTHAEVRMTQDLIAQIDAAFNPDVPPAPKAEESEAGRGNCRWATRREQNLNRRRKPSPGRKKGARE